MLSCMSKFSGRLIFSGCYLLKISFNQFLWLTKKFVEICIFPNIHVYVCIYDMIYGISTCIFAYR